MKTVDGNFNFLEKYSPRIPMIKEDIKLLILFEKTPLLKKKKVIQPMVPTMQHTKRAFLGTLKNIANEKVAMKDAKIFNIISIKTYLIILNINTTPTAIEIAVKIADIIPIIPDSISPDKISLIELVI